MKTISNKLLILAAALIGITACKIKQKQINPLMGKLVVNEKLTLESGIPFGFTVTAIPDSFAFPALHSFSPAWYKGLWVFIGGKKNGFHGKANIPPGFISTSVNDSLWVIDFVNKKSWGVPVPPQYLLQLTTAGAQSCQSGTSIYLCGGFTRTDAGAKVLNTTSSYFMELDLARLIQYVQSGGVAPSFLQVVKKSISSPYVQVAGGEMVTDSTTFYIIGGQNYDARYTAGKTGIYTNSVRRFDLRQIGSTWLIADTASTTDAVNLHRRDMNVIPYMMNSHMEATLYGGVFTSKDQAYLNPVNITGLDAGLPAINVDSMQQKVNEYTCAKATMSFGSNFYISALFGGISYKLYNPDSNKLVTGDHGVPMPFSNLVSIILKYGHQSPIEVVQLPPAAPLLPAYLGSNGLFVPLPQFALAGHPDMLNGNVVAKAANNNPATPLLIGNYLRGHNLYGANIRHNARTVTSLRMPTPIYMRFICSNINKFKGL